MTTTYRADFSAALKAYHDGQPFIVFETYDRSKPPFDTLISLTPRPGVSLAELEALIERLNECVASVALTPLPADAT